MIDAYINVGAPQDAASAWLAAVIETARARGVSQAALATRAGISAEALSRLKKSGRCRLVTALALARAAGIDTIRLRGGQRGRTAATIAARKLSAGRSFAIEPEQLVAALANPGPTAPWRAHLIGFFEELPIEAVHDVVLDEGLDYAALVSRARAVGAEGETVDWLAEMAGDGVA